MAGSSQPDVRARAGDEDALAEEAGESRRSPATVPAGHYAIEPEPWGAPYVAFRDDEEAGPAQPRSGWKADERGLLKSAGPRDNIVLHREDAPGLVMLDGTSMGCCSGPLGDSGLNRACPCGQPVATLAADCSTVYELHLDADSVRAEVSDH